MEGLLSVLAGLAGLAIGIAAGLWVGKRLRGVAYAWYWVANGVALVIGIVGNAAGLAYSQWWLVLGSLAFIAGSLTGLKYGLGRSVGLWRVHDNMLGNDDLPRE